MTTRTDGGFPTLAEVANRLDPNGMTAVITNILTKENPILLDMPWFEGNLTTGHRIKLTSGSLPQATWRQINQGVDPDKGEVSTYDEACALLEGECIIDEALLELNGGMAWRQTEEGLWLEGMSQQYATALFYEDAGDNPERIHGLAPRFPATTGYRASGQVVVGSNAGSNARSIWALTPRERKLYCVYPKGTKAGIETKDNGRQRVTDSAGKAYYAFSTSFKWRVGLAIEDYRYAARAQWDPDDPVMAGEEKGLILLMVNLVNRLYKKDERTRLYMDRDTISRLNEQCISNDNNLLTYFAAHNKQMGDSAIQGDVVGTFMGYPIRCVDALVAESAIS